MAHRHSGWRRTAASFRGAIMARPALRPGMPSCGPRSRRSRAPETNEESLPHPVVPPFGPRVAKPRPSGFDASFARRVDGLIQDFGANAMRHPQIQCSDAWRGNAYGTPGAMRGEWYWRSAELQFRTLTRSSAIWAAYAPYRRRYSPEAFAAAAASRKRSCGGGSWRSTVLIMIDEADRSGRNGRLHRQGERRGTFSGHGRRSRRPGIPA